MTAASEKPTREERLAAKLRENLRRRKVQSRQLGDSPEDSLGDALPKPEGRG